MKAVGLALAGLLAALALAGLIILSRGSRPSAIPAPVLGEVRTPPDTLAATPIPAALTRLAAEHRNGASKYESGQGLLSPVRTVVLTNSPTLTWRPVPSATVYEVEIRDMESGRVIAALRTTNANVEASNLPRSRFLNWTVRAMASNGSIVKVFAASDKLPSTFEVLSPRDANIYLAKARPVFGHNDPIGVAEIAMRAGLVEEAERFLSVASSGYEDGPRRPHIRAALIRLENRGLPTTDLRGRPSGERRNGNPPAGAVRLPSKLR